MYLTVFFITSWVSLSLPTVQNKLLLELNGYFFSTNLLWPDLAPHPSQDLQPAQSLLLVLKLKLWKKLSSDLHTWKREENTSNILMEEGTSFVGDLHCHPRVALSPTWTWDLSYSLLAHMNPINIGKLLDLVLWHIYNLWSKSLSAKLYSHHTHTVITNG